MLTTRPMKWGQTMLSQAPYGKSIQSEQWRRVIANPRGSGGSLSEGRCLRSPAGVSPSEEAAFNRYYILTSLADEIIGPGPALRIDNHFSVMLSSRRPTRPTHSIPVAPAAQTSAGAIASRRASQLPAD